MPRSQRNRTPSHKVIENNSVQHSMQNGVNKPSLNDPIFEEFIATLQDNYEFLQFIISLKNSTEYELWDIENKLLELGQTLYDSQNK